MNSLELKNLIRICFDKFQTKEEINSFLLSAYFIKSIVRGDFVPGKSDIDILFIFKNEISYKKQAEFTEKFSLFVKDSLNDNDKIFSHYKGLDILYICENEIPKTEIDFLNSPFSIFTAFGFDLEENHELFGGDDILCSFSVPDPLLFTEIQIKRILEKNLKGDSDAILDSGQIVRLLLIKYGLRSLHKQKIREFIENNTDIELWLKEFAINHLLYCYGEETNIINFENNCKEFFVKIHNYI